MEVAVESAEGLLNDAIVSVKCAHVRKIGLVSEALQKPFHFPAPSSEHEPANLKVELLHSLGSGWVVPRKGEERYVLDFSPKTARLNLEQRFSDNAAVTLSVKPRLPKVKDVGNKGYPPLQDAPAALIPGKSYTTAHLATAKQDAEEYLESHGITNFLHGLVHALLRDRPSDPYEFIATQLPTKGSVDDSLLRSKVEIRLQQQLTKEREALEQLQRLNTNLQAELAASKDQKVPATIHNPVVELSLVLANLDRDEDTQGVQLATKAAKEALSNKRPSLLRVMSGSNLKPVTFTNRGAAYTNESILKVGLDKFRKRLCGERSKDDEFRVLRQSVFTGEWKLYTAGGQAKKPGQYGGESRPPRAHEHPVHCTKCPFCVGNEPNTPDPILSVGPDGELRDGPDLAPDWLVRVIPNIFPLLVTPLGAYGETFRKKLDTIASSAVARGEHQNSSLRTYQEDPSSEGHYQVDAIGYSEVVVEHRDHNGLLGIVGWKQVALSLRCLQARGKALCALPGVRQLLYFKQYGKLSGGSLVHPHMQCVTLPLGSPYFLNRLRQARKYYNNFSKCSVCHCLCSATQNDRSASARLLHRSKHFVAVVPFACSQYRISIVPLVHSHTWLSLCREELEDLGWMLQLMMEALYHCLDDPAYNIYLFSADTATSLGEVPEQAVHWSLEVHPRFPADIGGVELASGIRIVGGLPEDFGKELRIAVDERLAARTAPPIAESTSDCRDIIEEAEQVLGASVV